MPRYIDADLLLERIYPYNCVDKSKYAINAKAVFEAIRKSPTADVAPKSEVAREIFDELDRMLLDGFIGHKYPTKIIHPDTYAELKKKYTGE
jgi:hypothetical protein